MCRKCVSVCGVSSFMDSSATQRVRFSSENFKTVILTFSLFLCFEKIILPLATKFISRDSSLQDCMQLNILYCITYRVTGYIGCNPALSCDKANRKRPSGRSLVTPSACACALVILLLVLQMGGVKLLIVITDTEHTKGLCCCEQRF
jgi:hypothetical protein